VRLLCGAVGTGRTSSTMGSAPETRDPHPRIAGARGGSRGVRLRASRITYLRHAVSRAAIAFECEVRGARALDLARRAARPGRRGGAGAPDPGSAGGRPSVAGVHPRTCPRPWVAMLASAAIGRASGPSCSPDFGPSGRPSTASGRIEPKVLFALPTAMCIAGKPRHALRRPPRGAPRESCPPSMTHSSCIRTRAPRGSVGSAEGKFDLERAPPPGAYNPPRALPGGRPSLPSKNSPRSPSRRILIHIGHDGQSPSAIVHSRGRGSPQVTSEGAPAPGGTPPRGTMSSPTYRRPAGE
jgi:hypothetical protein